MTAMRGFDAAAVRGVYGTFPSGVVAICARSDDGEPVGLVASTFVAGNRFDGLAVTVADSGAVLVDGAAAWLECRIETAVRTGDHDLVLLRVETMAKHDDVAPLVFHAGGFHALAAA
ncbi:MAG: hypothetical protein ABS81_02550 [Pseudonocardia sp. SCN 72-86]|nr:MAG: hypothetical protein ABS81_02550 [Pseudonocardia sp. SCN 72-86]